jgi:GntR family transcriptional regulator, arabinose operon transcriptional repressor
MHQQVYDALHRAIAEGRYAPGAKLPSEAALVRQFDSSRITVGRALRDLQTQGFIERRAGSGSYVTQKASKAAGMTFGLLIPDLGQTEVFEPICQAIAQSRQNNNYALMWGNGGSPPELCRQFIERKVHGVFFAPMEWGGPQRDLENTRILEAFREARIPVVLLDRDAVPYPQRSDWDLVGIDNRRAGFRITEHLIRAAGVTRLKFLATPNSAPTVTARIAGFREALAASDATGEVIHHPNQLLGAEAVVCANDRTAARLLGVLASQGRRVAQDVRIGSIDNLPFSALLTPPLTTVAQPCHEIGEAALAAMLERVASPGRAPREILLNCQLVVRESCGSGISLVQE